MKKITNLFSNIKNYNDEVFLRLEKITIIGRNKIYIQNYDEIEEIQDHFIKLKNVTIKGNNLKITSVSKYFIEIVGKIDDIHLGVKFDEA